MAFRSHGAPRVSWWGSTVPPTGPQGTGATWVGVDFELLVPGRIAGFRLYQQAGNSGTHFAALMNLQVLPVGQLQAIAKFEDNGAPSTGWYQAWFHPWFRPQTNQDYRLAVYFGFSGFFRQNNALAAGDVAHNGISFINSWQSTALGIFSAAPTTNKNANAIDILFQPD